MSAHLLARFAAGGLASAVDLPRPLGAEILALGADALAPATSPDTFGIALAATGCDGEALAAEDAEAAGGGDGVRSPVVPSKDFTMFWICSSVGLGSPKRHRRNPDYSQALSP